MHGGSSDVIGIAVKELVRIAQKLPEVNWVEY
jgi:hypothetical protein